MEVKLAGRTSEAAKDWKKSRDSNGVYADRGGIPHCPPGRPLAGIIFGMGATVVGMGVVGGEGRETDVEVELAGGGRVRSREDFRWVPGRGRESENEGEGEGERDRGGRAGKKRKRR
jgi:hypothetical protein